jgi:hypothetical protein
MDLKTSGKAVKKSDKIQSITKGDKKNRRRKESYIS